MQMDDVEPVVEVGAESPVGHHIFEVPVGRRDKPYVYLERLVGPDGFEAPVLNDLQQLALQRKGHVSDLVQEQGASIGQCKLALLA